MQTIFALFLVTTTMSFTVPQAFGGDDCNATRTFVSLQGITSDTSYMRVHPSGNYLLFSGEQSTIVDLTNPDHPVGIKTSMNKESYPVEAEKKWKWIASPNHGKEGKYDTEHGVMKYFDFENTLADGVNSQSYYEDPDHNQYYHSAAELPGSTSSTLHFRTALWGKLRYRDYTVDLGADGKPTKVEHGEVMNLCPNIKSFSTPILSKDGTEVAGLTELPLSPEAIATAADTEIKPGEVESVPRNITMKVFKIRNDGSCDLEYDTHHKAGKVSFSYPKDGKKALITFIATIMDPGGSIPSQIIKEAVWVYNPNTDKTYRVSDVEDSRNLSYPGFTEDGRIVYVSSATGKFGVTFANPSALLTGRCEGVPTQDPGNQDNGHH